MRFKIGDWAWDIELNCLVSVIGIGPLDSKGNQWYTLRSFGRLIYEKMGDRLVRSQDLRP